MSVKTEDRPIEVFRTEVIDQLIMNYSHNKLSYEAFERRLDSAMECKTNKELAELAHDLPLKVDKAYAESKEQDLGVNFVPGETEKHDTIVNIFSGSTRSGAWKVAKEINCFSLFSGSDIDFTEAQFTHPVVKVKIFSLFSGDDILVPHNVNVITKVFCVFAGIDNLAPNKSSANAPTIIIEGIAIFSGLDIKIKRTLKEKWVDFAEGMKKLFS